LWYGRLVQNVPIFDYKQTLQVHTDRLTLNCRQGQLLAHFMPYCFPPRMLYLYCMVSFSVLQMGK